MAQNYIGPKKPRNNFIHNIDGLANPEWYSHSTSLDATNRTISTSGIIGQRKDGSFPPTLAEQVPLVLSNVTEALRAAGALYTDIVQMRFYVVDWQPSMAMDVMGHLFAWLKGVKPATTLVPVSSLAYPEAKIEIETIAAVTGNSKPWTPLDGHFVKEQQPEKLPVHSTAVTETEVIIVGGGFSGMAAAYELKQAGIKSIVLEARHRIGGKSWSTKLKSGPGFVDLGATWINEKTQPVVYALAKKFALETFAQYTTGLEVFEGVEGRPAKVTDSLSGVDTIDRDAAQKIGQAIGLLSETADSWDIRKFDQLRPEEDVSVAQWCREQGVWNNAGLRAQVRSLTTGLVGGEPDEVGIHYLFDYIKSGNGLTSLITEDENGAQHLKIKGGTSMVTEALAAALEPGSVRLRSPVDSISQYGKQVTVTTASGQVFKTSKVIMANPTHTYEKIDFSPPLPSTKRALVSRTRGGDYAKVILTYASPWWRDAGLVGKFTSLKGPICFSWELCDFAANSFNLALFVAGERCKRWASLSSDLARHEAIIEHLAHLASAACENPALADKARDVIEVNMIHWNKEEYLDGAPTSYMGPGMLRQYGPDMREPFQDVHFAGGEFAFEWKGYLEGAVTSGQRAAKEVIGSIKH